MDNIKEKQGQIAIEAIRQLNNLVCIYEVNQNIYDIIVNANNIIKELENSKNKRIK